MSKLIHRPYWKCYFAETDAIIYVVDAADVDRAAISKAELALVLEEEDLKGCALLVLANKQVWHHLMSILGPPGRPKFSRIV